MGGGFEQWLKHLTFSKRSYENELKRKENKIHMLLLLCDSHWFGDIGYPQM